MPDNMHEGFEMNATDRARRWPALARVTLFMFSCAVVLAAVAPIAKKLPGKWLEFVIGTVASLGAFALTALFVRWERLRLKDVGAAADAGSPARLIFGFLVGLLLAAVWAAILAAAVQTRWVRAPDVGFGATALALMAYLVLACREELAFHGYPLRRLNQLYGLWPAQLFVAVVFAVEHRVGGWTWMDALLGAGVGSLLFGMVAIATRGLAVPIGVHAAWNFGQWTLGLKGTPGIWKSVVEEGREGRAHRVETIIYVVVMGTATIVFWLWHRRSDDRQGN
jgi:membrane protease YdiL (CAAX protease family)